ncbi:prosaposin [Ischnura elegans]|uniref:prosaposin n=1 Tax=Ischnura elegans TaxID=197161 RepID=UPI001ED8806F|nr:prosaposin [Ischnura elegans]
MYGKLFIIAALCAVQCLLGVHSMGLLGKEMCSKGQAYWCNNLRNAKSCNAVKHCIQSVWERQTLPEDNGDICNICKDMVTQARAQLESNETQEELKEVFEGSCKLIPVKIVTQECIKMVDEFIPELVETLASQMNPQMVCSVAGLCNSARNDQLLAEYKANLAVSKNSDDCNGCRVVVATMKDRFQGMNRDQFMEELLELCGKTGSLSDGCSSLVVAHLNTIYNHLTNNLHPKAVCDLAGVCHANYHQHKKPEVQIINESSTGTLSHDLEAGEDVPCELCEQLVVHLRDVLVTNTTEDEFKLVLEGLCKQTGSFKSECLGLVDNYFDGLFKFLTSELNPTTACQAIHICNGAKRPKVSITPLLPADQVVPVEEELGHVPLSKVYTGGWKEEGLKKPNLPRVKLEKDLHKELQAPETAQLPIERTMPQTVLTLGNKPVCELCEYFLHYLQQALTTPATEEKIREIVDHGCEKLPSSISASCVDFVNTYGDALVSLLAQEIDPSQVCPGLGVCPGVQLLTRPLVGDKPTCPLCLMAIEQLDKVLKDNKTEESIKDALENVCSSMPSRLVAECDSLVDQYTEELVDMLIADFTPQEVCVYLKLCTGGSRNVPTNPKADFEIMTNEIPDYKVTHMEEVAKVLPSHVPKKFNGKKAKDSSTCVICEFIMSQIDNALKDNATDEEIKHAVHTVCNHLPMTVGKECNGFVDQYADVVISLLAEFMDPKDVCSALKLCSSKFLNKSSGPATVHLLGGKKCTWGPSYWCQSEFHANACKATKHCQDKVWNGLKPVTK